MLPAFLRKAPAYITTTTDPEPGAVAHVGGWNPNTVVVDVPGLFSKGVLAHEMTHVWQNSHIIPHKGVMKNGVDEYDYGSIKGLQKAIKEHKSIDDFGDEQQAEIVQDWYDLHSAMYRLAKDQGGYLTAMQAHWFEQTKKVYQHFISQISHAPVDDSDPDTKTPPKIPVPGLPPAEVVGFAESSPDYGGGPVKVKRK